MQLQGSI